jgi:hypothetical protein
MLKRITACQTGETAQNENISPMTTPLIIANPVYDCVFKFLLEDTEIAKGLIGLITGQKVESINLLPQEFTTTVHDLVIRRMDYTAEVWDENGKLKKVLIEMQKAKFPGDVPHFRHYLGNAIGRPVIVTRSAAEMARLRANEERRRAQGEKVSPATAVKDAYPPVMTIYFLGYTLSESVRAPLIKAGGGCENLITGKPLDGSQDEFIQCLTVLSFIIQLPEVREEPLTELDYILALFRELEPHKREIQVNLPEGAPDSSFLWRVVKRLMIAIADPEIRMAMENEEIFERSMLQHSHDQQIREEHALEQLAAERAEKLAAQDREAQAQAKATQAQDREAQAQAREAQAQAREAEMRRKIVHVLSSLGKTVEEISVELGIESSVVRALLI